MWILKYCKDLLDRFNADFFLLTLISIPKGEHNLRPFCFLPFRLFGLGVRRGSDGMVVGLFNATFNTISVISWRSVLLVEETKSVLRKPSTCGK
jgi:hypothetical protein